MKIGVISDIHCGTENRERCLAVLEDAVSGLSESECVVLLGDMITDSDTETDTDMMQAVADRAAQLGCPVRAVLGNHDIGNLSAEAPMAPFQQERYGMETIAGQDIIFLDSSAPWIPGSRGELSEEQLEFLEETLPEVDDAIVFVHHPIHYHDISDNPWFGEYPERGFCGNKKEVNQLFDEYGGVRAVFNGHLHESDHTVYSGVHHVTVPPFARGCPAERSKVSGKHAVVDVSPEELEVTVQTPDEQIGGYTL